MIRLSPYQQMVIEGRKMLDTYMEDDGSITVVFGNDKIITYHADGERRGVQWHTFDSSLIRAAADGHYTKNLAYTLLRCAIANDERVTELLRATSNEVTQRREYKRQLDQHRQLSLL